MCRQTNPSPKRPSCSTRTVIVFFCYRLTPGHLNGSATGNTIMLDFKMNSSAVGIDGLNQLGLAQMLEGNVLTVSRLVARQLYQVFVTPQAATCPNYLRKTWTGSYIGLSLLTKRAPDLRLDPRVSGEHIQRSTYCQIPALL